MDELNLQPERAEPDMLEAFHDWMERRGPLGAGAMPERIFFAGWLAARRAVPVAQLDADLPPTGLRIAHAELSARLEREVAENLSLRMENRQYVERIRHLERELAERSSIDDQLTGAPSPVKQDSGARSIDTPEFRALADDWAAASWMGWARKAVQEKWGALIAYIDGRTAVPAKVIDSFKMDSGHTVHREARGNGHEWVLRHPDGSAVRGLDKYESDFVASALRAGLACGRTAGTASEATPEAVSVMLWLYRRLPRCYGRPPHVEGPITALAKVAGINMKDVSESFAERGADPIAAAPSTQEAAKCSGQS